MAGYILESFRVTVYAVFGGVLIASVICVPDWGIFKGKFAPALHVLPQDDLARLPLEFAWHCSVRRDTTLQCNFLCASVILQMQAVFLLLVSFIRVARTACARVRSGVVGLHRNASASPSRVHVAFCSTCAHAISVCKFVLIHVRREQVKTHRSGYRRDVQKGLQESAAAQPPPHNPLAPRRPTKREAPSGLASCTVPIDMPGPRSIFVGSVQTEDRAPRGREEGREERLVCQGRGNFAKSVFSKKAGGHTLKSNQN